jgi:hypothetical protein
MNLNKLRVNDHFVTFYVTVSQLSVLSVQIVSNPKIRK